jgi:D-ribose pyranase
MKRGGVLHPDLSAGLAGLGHGDAVVLADAGLRIPAGARSIHLELSCGVPTMAQVAAAVAQELVIESAIVASEFAEWNPEVHEAVLGLLPVVPEVRPHEALMADMAGRAALWVKTGECSAYASVVLIAGVSYFDEAVALHERLLAERAG